MGNNQKKNKSETTTLEIQLESQHASFNGVEPILANIVVKSEEPVKAYGLQVSVI